MTERLTETQQATLTAAASGLLRCDNNGGRVNWYIYGKGPVLIGTIRPLLAGPQPLIQRRQNRAELTAAGRLVLP